MAMITSTPQAHHFQGMCTSATAAVCARPAASRACSLKPNAVSNEQQTAVHGAPSDGAGTSLVFVYGTLKRGFGNHWLIEEQTGGEHCRLVGSARTKFKYPLVCGPFQVPFLLDMAGSGEHVSGELYLVDAHCRNLLDELEGTAKGHYVRRTVTLSAIELDPSVQSSLRDRDDEVRPVQRLLQGQRTALGGDLQAEAYFAASHFTKGLCQAPHLEAYTLRESATYTRRKYRPQNRTFIEHVYHWIDEQRQIRNGVIV